MTDPLPAGEIIPTVVTLWWSEEEEGLEEAEIVEDELSCDGEAEAFSPAPPQVERARDPLSTVTLAEIYLAQGFYDQALQIYRDLANAEPDNDELLLRIAEIDSLRSAEFNPQAGGDADAPVIAEAVMYPLAVDTTPDSRREQAVAILEQWLAGIERRRACR